MKVLYSFNLFCIYALGMLSFYSPFRALSYFNQLWSIFMVLWLCTAFMVNPGHFVRPNRYYKLMYIYLIYTIGLPFITVNSTIGFRYFELSQIYMFLFAFNFIKSIGGNKDNIKIILGLIPFVIVTSFITIKAYLINPLTSRLIKESLGGGLAYLQSGVGGYHYIYFLTIIVVTLLYLIKSDNYKNKYVLNILIGLFMILITLNIIYSNYSTALLLLIISIFSRIFFPKIANNLIGQYFFRIMILSLLMYIVILPAIDYVVYILAGTLNSDRLKEIRYIISGNEIGDSTYSRLQAYISSIQAFMSYPITGVIFNNLKFQSGGLTGFGQHSFILDTYALYGFGIGTLNIYLLASPLISRIKSINPFANAYAANLAIVFVLLSLFNNMTPSIGFAAFFVYPSVYETFIQSSDSGEIASPE